MNPLALAGSAWQRGARMLVVSLLAVAALAALPSFANARSVSQPAAEVLEYWTPERMAAARPADLLTSTAGRVRRVAGADSSGRPLLVPAAKAGSAAGGPLLRRSLFSTARAADGSRYAVGQPGAPGNRTHGRVFITLPGLGDFACSGTVVSSFTRSLVATAGHCVSEGSAFATNWMFVPAYTNGSEPFGRWTATELGTTEGWRASSDLRYDVGMAEVAPNTKDETIQEVVGARGIAFNQPRDQFYTAYGYPAEQPPFEFTGEQEFACASSWRGDDTGLSAPRPMKIACDMTAGSSGGGWVVGGSVLSVSSFKAGAILVPDNRFMYGPYFGEEIRSLYERMRGEPITCRGREATIFGSAAGETLKGTKGDDVIAALGGADTIKARKGNDLVCGGGGNDVIEGGAGKDKLIGAGGNDVLAGGRGKDKCIGNKGRDKGRGCEKEKSIP